MKRYVTTAIDYVNSVPHIGTAYEKIGADVLVRFYRFMGDQVKFQMGNDEHSANVQKAAEKENLDPKVYCDGMRPKFEEAWQRLAISNTDFIQTSEQRHHNAVLKFFDLVFKKGDIEQRDYEGWYCESCEAFYTEKDLEDGVCPNHKTKPKWLKEKNYFFLLTKYQNQLLEHIKKNPNFILPAKRRNEVVNFIESGLADISISRSTFSWGIPVPIDAKHVFYVWFDALINYITGAQYGVDEAAFNEKWQNVIHIVGKDITRFHCVIWPAMLLSAGLPLPQHVFGHGFVYMKGEKMSKSLGNVVTPMDILNKYPDFGSDALRYYLLRTSSFGDDGDFTWDGFIDRYNADLANGYGNLVSRTLGMVWRYQQGIVAPIDKNHALSATSDALLKEAAQVFEKIREDLDFVKKGDILFHGALEKAWGYLAKIDQFIDQAAPWTLAKEKKSDDLSVVLTTVVEAIRLASLLLHPVIPTAVEKAWIGFGFDQMLALKDAQADALGQIQTITKDHKLTEQKIMLFPRLEKEKKAMTESENNTAKADAKQNAAKQNESGLIDIKDFLSVDLRVAKIVEAEKVPEADKLLKLQVELGEGRRQIVAGIAEFYEPDQLLNKSVVVVANLKPATIRGVESHGMLLAAKKGRKLVVVSPDGEIPSNAKVG